MASSASSPVLRVQSTAGGNSSVTPHPDSFPVPPDWIIKDPQENRRHILAMLEQGDRDIAANRGCDAEDVFAAADEIIATATAAKAR